MADNIKTIQLRMNTVDQVSKITNAMKLVSMSKLQKFQRQIKELESFAEDFNSIQTKVFAQDDQLPVLAVCVASDLGLASLYNDTIYNGLIEKSPEAVMWIGNQSYEKVEKLAGIQLVNERVESDELNLDSIYSQMVEYMHDYQLQLAIPRMEGNHLQVTWKNLSLELLDSDSIVYDPDYSTVNQRFKELYIDLTLRETYYQSKYNENLTRRIAMEKATDNANEMREELNNRYNQIRQEEITQEILELASGVE